MESTVWPWPMQGFLIPLLTESFAAFSSTLWVSMSLSRSLSRTVRKNTLSSLQSGKYSQSSWNIAVKVTTGCWYRTSPSNMRMRSRGWSVISYRSVMTFWTMKRSLNRTWRCFRSTQRNSKEKGLMRGHWDLSWRKNTCRIVRIMRKRCNWDSSLRVNLTACTQFTVSLK